jgi:hypothetical protein
MDLPEDLKLKAILTQGGVFKAKLRENKDSYSRFYFVLNLNPETDDLLVLSTTTTHLELHRDCEGGDDIHIVLSSEDYEGFTRNCIMCCNRPLKVKKAKLEQQLKSQKYEILAPLPEGLLEKILQGIAKSNIVEPIVKKLVLKNDNG